MSDPKAEYTAVVELIVPARELDSEAQRVQLQRDIKKSIESKFGWHTDVRHIQLFKELT